MEQQSPAIGAEVSFAPGMGSAGFRKKRLKSAKLNYRPP
jgi:hypothetical protein